MLCGDIMESRALHALELPGVLSYLAGFTVSDAGFQAALALRPLFSLDAVRSASRLFEQSRLWVLRTERRLAPFPSMDGLLRNMESPSVLLDLDELFSLRQTLEQGREVVDAMLSDTAASEPAGWPLWEERCRNLVLPAQCLTALKRCLSEEGTIRDEASPELSLVRGELRRLHQQCARKVKEYAM